MSRRRKARTSRWFEYNGARLRELEIKDIEGTLTYLEAEEFDKLQAEEKKEYEVFLRNDIKRLK